MSSALSLLDITWWVTTAAELVLLATLVWRKAFQSYPVFTAYMLSILLQSAAMFFLYRQPNLSSATVWNIAWGTQAAITMMRSLVLVELTRKILARYASIWVLARGLILCVGLCVIAYALAFSRGHSQWIILNMIRGVELALAAVIVTMFLFARYYRLPIASASRAVALGLCLYSVFYVIDYSLLEKGFKAHAELWNFLGILTFLASLLLWTAAFLLYPVREEKAHPVSISPEAYGKLSSEVNLRLYLLNRQLNQILNSEERRP
jgi:hypothetical protein